MFKELVETIEELFKPVIILPKFIEDTNKPLGLISALYCTNGLSSKTDDYIKFITSKNGDRIYVIYNGLYSEKNCAILDDIMIYKGSPTLVTVVDYETVRDGNDDIEVKLIFAASLSSICFLKAKYATMFCMGNTMNNLFDEARIIVFIASCLSIFRNSNKLEELMIENICTIRKDFNLEILQEYIDIITENGVEFLLDYSIAAGYNKDNNKEDLKKDNDE